MSEFFWRERWRPNRPLTARDIDGIDAPDKPSVHVSPATYQRLVRYAVREGITVQRALDRVFGMERNGPAEKQRAIENRRKAG